MSRGPDDRAGLSHGELRLIAVLLAVNLIGLAVITFRSGGTDLYLGSYLSHPLYYYLPDRLAVAVSLSSLTVGVTLLVASAVTPEARLARGVALAAGLGAPLALLAGVAVQEALLAGRALVMGGSVDSYAIQVSAARALLQGRDPYIVNYTPYLLNATTGATWLTIVYSHTPPPYSMNNVVGVVGSLDYPAMSFLYYVPAVALRLPGQVWGAAVLGASLAIFYLRLGPRGRALFPALLAASSFYFIVQPSVIGPSSQWLGPSIVALAFWDSPWIAGALLGLATSYRQYVASLSVIYVAYVAGRLGKGSAARAALAFAASSVALNAPFALMGVRAFARDVLLPTLVRLDVEGLGLSSLRYLGLAVPRDFSYALVAFLLALLTYVAYRFDVKWLWPMFAGLVFLVYPRPLYHWEEFMYMSAAAALLYLGGGRPSRALTDFSNITLAAGLAGAAGLVFATAPGLAWASLVLIVIAAAIAISVSLGRPLIRRPGRPLVVGASLLVGLPLAAALSQALASRPKLVVVVPAADLGLTNVSPASVAALRGLPLLYTTFIRAALPYGSTFPPLPHQAPAGTVTFSGSVVLSGLVIVTLVLASLWPFRSPSVASAALAAASLAAYVPLGLPEFAAVEAVIMTWWSLLIYRSRRGAPKGPSSPSSGTNKHREYQDAGTRPMSPRGASC